MRLRNILFQTLAVYLLLGINPVEANGFILQSHKGMGVKANVVGKYKYKDGSLTLNVSELEVFPHEILDKPIYVHSLQFVVFQAKSVNELSSKYKVLCGSIPVDRKLSHEEPFLMDTFSISYKLNAEFDEVNDQIALKICLGTGTECGRHTWAFDKTNW